MKNGSLREQGVFVCLVFWSILNVTSALGQGRPSERTQEGRLYGKVLDQSTRKPLEFAVIRVSAEGVAGDTTSWKVLTGALSMRNGDFSMDGVPVGRDLKVEVNLVGYSPFSRIVKMEPSRTGTPEKDVGNIFLALSATLKEVEIVEEVQPFRIEFDKRIYDVEKNPINEGGTAEDVLQNIPGVNVDVDGNVSVRNSSPQIFVDGRPTNLSIDQIPADAIQRVEIITNPSARYDASGGGGGIINIVMKKNRSMGYNGSMRSGIDSRARVNGGIDFNLREGKLNFFGGFNYNQRRRISTGTTDRNNYFEPKTNVFQSQRNVNDGDVIRVNLGVDWLIDNRNTLTANPSIFRGTFNPWDTLRVVTDTLFTTSDVPWAYTRQSETSRSFQNVGGSLLFKHLFENDGDEITADLSYNQISSELHAEYINRYPGLNPSIFVQSGNVAQSVGVAQIDYTRRIGENLKLETGMRAAIREYTSVYENFNKDIDSGALQLVRALNVNYRFLDQVYAAYGSAYINSNKWKIQTGLRIENSDYRAELIDTTISFRNHYPLSLFPSAFITYVISDKQDLQLAANRRISRPNFHVLSPFIDYSDSLNISRGNPALRPEFTQTAELSYQHTFNAANTFIAALYGRYSTNLTVTHLITEYSPVLDRDVVMSTYKNAASSSSAGLELISRNKVTKWLEINSNLNLFWSQVNGSNIQSSLTNSLSSWLFKLNATFKLPNNFTFQVTGDYTSRRMLESTGSSRGGGGIGEGGGGPWNMALNTVQGYIDPVYGIDFSLRREFLKDRRLSASVSIRDAFRTRVNVVHSTSPFFVQDTFRRRDPQIVRFNLSWKFGKADTTLFRRKNTRQSGEMMEG